MTCTEFENSLTEYLAGELPRPEAAEAHLAGCAVCRGLVEATRRVDRQLREAVLAEEPSTAAVLSRVRLEIRQESDRRQWLRIAAAVFMMVACGVGYRQFVQPRTTGFGVAAVRDHRAEVVGKARRRWRTSQDDMTPLLAQYGVTQDVVARLNPTGLVLKQAKECGLEGKRALHLVFSDGGRAVSVFFRNSPTEVVADHHREGEEQVESFLGGVVVATGNPELCAEAARRLSAL
jgi:hypothetical protein